MINLIGISKITDLMDVVLSSLNVKLVDLTIFLLSCIETSSCYKAFCWLMPPIDWVEVPESISNLLNLMSLYCKIIDRLKI